MFNIKHIISAILSLSCLFAIQAQAGNKTSPEITTLAHHYNHSLTHESVKEPLDDPENQKGIIDDMHNHIAWHLGFIQEKAPSAYTNSVTPHQHSTEHGSLTTMDLDYGFTFDHYFVDLNLEGASGELSYQGYPLSHGGHIISQTNYNLVQLDIQAARLYPITRRIAAAIGLDGYAMSFERSEGASANEDIDQFGAGTFFELDFALAPDFIVRLSQTFGITARSSLEIPNYAYEASLGNKPFSKTNLSMQYEVEDNWFLTGNAYFEQYGYKASKPVYIPEIDETIAHPKSTMRFFGFLIGVDYVLG